MGKRDVTVCSCLCSFATFFTLFFLSETLEFKIPKKVEYHCGITNEAIFGAQRGGPTVGAKIWSTMVNRKQSVGLREIANLVSLWQAHAIMTVSCRSVSMTSFQRKKNRWPSQRKRCIRSTFKEYKRRVTAYTRYYARNVGHSSRHPPRHPPPLEQTL